MPVLLLTWTCRWTWACIPNSNLLLLMFLSILLCSTSSASSSSPAVCSEADRASLLSFKSRIFKDTTQMLSSWTGRDCCAGGWEGVECNPGGRVTVLQLQRPASGPDYMKGTLSPSLANLNFLEVLVISGLKLITGPIPQSFSNLIHLTQLALEDNSLAGPIPSGLGRLSSLQSLSLSGNRFSSHIPPSLGHLLHLLQLGLARNSFTGPIPPTFLNFHALQYLDFSFNALSGPIPDFVGRHPVRFCIPSFFIYFSIQLLFFLLRIWWYVLLLHKSQSPFISFKKL